MLCARTRSLLPGAFSFFLNRRQQSASLRVFFSLVGPSLSILLCWAKLRRLLSFTFKQFTSSPLTLHPSDCWAIFFFLLAFFLFGDRLWFSEFRSRGFSRFNQFTACRFLIGSSSSMPSQKSMKISTADPFLEVSSLSPPSSSCCFSSSPS